MRKREKFEGRGVDLEAKVKETRKVVEEEK
jgi:hypothetical protein